MHILVFIFIILLPFLSVLGLLGQTDSIVPHYFANEESHLLAAIFGSIIAFWLGLGRNYAGYNGIMTDQTYQKIIWGLLIFLFVSKLIFAVPHMWLPASISFVSGWLCVSRGQIVTKASISIMGVISIILVCYLGFLLIAFAWFGYRTSTFYYFIITLDDRLLHWARGLERST